MHHLYYSLVFVDINKINTTFNFFSTKLSTSKDTYKHGNKENLLFTCKLVILKKLIENQT